MTDYLQGPYRWYFTCRYCGIRKNGDHNAGNHYIDQKVYEEMLVKGKFVCDLLWWCMDKECLKKHNAEYVIRDHVAHKDLVATYVKRSTYVERDQEKEKELCDTEYINHEKI